MFLHVSYFPSLFFVGIEHNLSNKFTTVQPSLSRGQTVYFVTRIVRCRACHCECGCLAIAQ